MSPEREWRFRIEHILEAIEKIVRYTAPITYEQFAADERTVDAVIRNFLVIGEATRHVPDHARASAAEIPWKLMEGRRHPRAFFREDRDHAREELKKARALIERCGYHRRDEELRDAEEAIG